jgi:pilus assembly protein CpaC
MDLAEKFAGGGNYGSIVNAIKISGEDQVMLKVRVVEVQRDILKDFGIDLSAAVSIGSLAFDLSTNPFLAGGQFVSRFSKNGDRISSTVQALESDGLLRILAEPNLTAVSGESAKFHAGGEIAVCGSRDESGNCQTDYREFGVSLNFTPVVLDQGRISLKIATEVSELNTANTVAGIPGFSSRSAETTIELPSGGSMMLAGLIKDSVRQQINGTPWLKDLPVLGSLFRSRNYTANESELVIIVTPYLVGPLHESQLATPADNFNAPTDRQGNLFGRLNKVYGTPGKHPDGVYHGNIGFIVQ